MGQSKKGWITVSAGTIAAVAALALLIIDFNISGEKTILYSFVPHPAVVPLSPVGRVQKIQKSPDGLFQEMVGEPVYFDVRASQPYRQAQIAIEFQKDPEGMPFSIGVQLEEGEWAWHLEQIEGQLQPDGWVIGEATLPLSRARLSDGWIRFLLASPGIEDRRGRILLRKIRVTFLKEPATARTVLRRVREYGLSFLPF